MLYLYLNVPGLYFSVEQHGPCLPLFSGKSFQCSSEETSQGSQSSDLTQRHTERQLIREVNLVLQPPLCLSRQEDKQFECFQFLKVYGDIHVSACVHDGALVCPYCDLQLNQLRN